MASLPSMFVILTIAASAVEALKCPDSDARNFADGICIYFRKLGKNRKIEESIQWASTQCQELNELPYIWRLPKLDTQAKNDALEAIIQNRFDVDQELYFWIGLVRDEPTTSTEVSDLNQWRDETKWRWVADNSTLASMFPDRTAPWELNEPNNREKIERCVYADPGYETVKLKWFDNPCNGNAYLLVCESAYIGKEKPKQAICMSANGGGTSKISSGTTLAICLAILAIAIGTGLALYIWKRRRIEVSGIDGMGAPFFVSGSNGVQENMSRYKKLLATTGEEHY